jgi:D-alanyl-D-alanine carboxypeptidase
VCRVIAPIGFARTARWSLTAAALALAAAAQAEPGAISYPRSRAVADVAAWIASDTPVSPSQVVDVGPSAVTAVTSSAPTGSPRGFLANIAAEALDPSIGRQEEIVSWTIPVEVDCEKRLVRLGDMTGYSARDLKTAPRVVRPADTAWVTPSPNAPLGAVMRALCDRDFERPFATGVKIAKAAGKPARAPPPGPPPIVVSEKPPTKPTPLTTAAAANAKPAPPPKPEAAPVAHGTSPYAVQVGASPSEDDAKAILGRLQKKQADALKGFKTDVQAAQVDGKTVYRALVSGFAGMSAANALCEELKAGGHACFVRR